MSALPHTADAQPSRGTPPDGVTLFVAVGERLVGYHPDPAACSLTRKQGASVDIAAPAAIQYVWRHPALPLIYIAYSDRAANGSGRTHGVMPVRMGSDGRLRSAGEPLAFDNRPIHLTVDSAGRYLLVAFNEPSALSVHPLGADGSIGAAVVQPTPPDCGIYAHQVRVAPDDQTVILVTRGNDAARGRVEDPGALKVFDMQSGQLHSRQSVAPDGGYGFGPRHLDFAPGHGLVYVSMERENRLESFSLADGMLSPEPAFRATTLGGPASPGLRQLAGAIHVSADGRFVYVSNRADSRADVGGRSIFAGGENTMAVFAVDADSGRPVLVQTADIGRFHPRTFSIHPDGTMLVTAAIAPMPVLQGADVSVVPAGLTTFRIAADGRLERVYRVDIETNGSTVFWCGMLRHPA